MFRSLHATAVAFALVSAPALASTVEGTFSGTISAPVVHEGSTVWHTEGGQQQLFWGATPDAPEAGGAGSSWLRVDNGSFSDTVLDDGRILIGTITWFNRSNWVSGPYWSGSFTLNVNFDKPYDLAPVTQEVGFTSMATYDASRDTSANEASGDTPDEIQGLAFAADAFDVPFAIGNNLVLTGVEFEILQHRGDATVTNANAGTISWYDDENNIWTNREGGESVIGIYGEISSVPLPAGVWLILSGLGGLMVMRRRKHAAA